MKHLKNIGLGLVLLCTILSASAQVSKGFPKGINLIKMTDAGVAVVGTDDALYGIDKDGKELWKNEKLKKVEAERVEVLSGSELIFVSDKGMLSRNRVINVLTGVEYADLGIKHANIFGARVAHGTNQLWVMPTPKTIAVWDIEKNELLYTFQASTPFGIATDKSVALTATFSGMQPITYTGTNSAILHLGLKHLGEYDLSTGIANWLFDWKPYKVKKPEDGKGDKPSNPSRGFSVMKVDDSNNTLYFPFMDQLIAVNMITGSPVWDPKGGKTGKVRDMYIVDNGVLVLTHKGLQLIDKASGEPKWDKPIKIKGAAEGLLIEDNGQFYAVSKNTVVKIDVASRTATTLTEKIKFQGGETFTSLKTFGDILVLSASQNSVGIDKNSGSIKYSTYYKAPGAGFGATAANMALASVAMAATYNSYRINERSTIAVGGTKTVRYHQYTPRMISSGGSNTVNAGKTMYVSTKFKDDDATGFGVARVDRTSGETTDKIVIGSREPIYAVNENEGLIFFKSDKTTLSIKTIK